MNAAEAWRLSASDLVDAYRTRTLSPQDVMAATLARIASIDPKLGAFVALSPVAADEARRSAERWRAGTPFGPLDGVPVAVKDNLVVAGMPATFGSRLFARRDATVDELPIARLRAAGAIIVGKTNTPEFAVEGYTANALFGVTRNPFDPRLTPGGSSGGSVAAVAAGLVPLALGTDGGGSTRRPAAYTGLVGLKPGIGTIARAGGLPQILLDFEVVGTFARTAADTRLLFTSLAGRDRGDPQSRQRVPSIEHLPAARVRFVERLDDAPCDAAILRAVRSTAATLSDLGHIVEPAPLGIDTAALAEIWPLIVETGLAWLRAKEGAFDRLASPAYLEIAERGARRSAVELIGALKVVARIRAQTSRLFEDVDLILMPVCAAMPWAADEAFPAEIDGHTVGPRGHATYTGWVSAAGHPAISIPAPSDELPIGAQLVADIGGEDLLMELASNLDAQRRLFDRWPKTATAGDDPLPAVAINALKEVAQKS